MIELFILETCPYCQKVLNFLEDKDIEYRLINIANKESEESLIK